MRTLRIALAVLMIAVPGIAIAADSPMPDDESAFVAQFNFDAAAGAILAAPPAYKNKGAVDHSADWNAYSFNASNGSVDAAAPNASASLAQGAVDNSAHWNAYVSNAVNGSIDQAAPNASASLAQGALDFTEEFNSMVVDAVEGRIVTAQSQSTYVQKIVPTLAFWGSLALTLLLLYGLITRFRQRRRLEQTY